MIPMQKCFLLVLKLVHSIQTQSLPATAEEDSVQSDGIDSDHFSGSNSSFLANEKLMSVDSMNSDITGMICIHLLFYSYNITYFEDLMHP